MFLKKRVAVQDQDKSVIIPIKTAQKLLLGIDYISLMRIKLSNEAFISSTIEEIEKFIKREP